jgi:hypothetical protein
MRKLKQKSSSLYEKVLSTKAGVNVMLLLMGILFLSTILFACNSIKHRETSSVDTQKVEQVALEQESVNELFKVKKLSNLHDVTFLDKISITEQNNKSPSVEFYIVKINQTTYLISTAGDIIKMY